MCCRTVLNNLYPDCVQDFDNVLNKKSGHILNMFVMRYDLFLSYCQWLFNILFELEKHLNLKGYSQYQQRVYGYLAERLLDVWLCHNKLNYKEINYVVIEKIDWKKKILKFLRNNLVADR